jgi:hypothetical protein
VTHGDPIVNADGVELERHSAGSPHGFLHQLAETLQMHVPGDHIHVRVDDGDEGLAHIGIRHPGGFEEGTVGGSFDSGFDLV